MGGFDPSAVKTVEEVLDITEANVFFFVSAIQGSTGLPHNPYPYD